MCSRCDADALELLTAVRAFAPPADGGDVDYDDEHDGYEPAPTRDGLVVGLLAFLALLALGSFVLLVYIAQQVSTP